MDTKRGFPLLLSSFWLKIIAILTMTVDHVGVMFDITPCRYIGRLALPLFCFMAAEGVKIRHYGKRYIAYYCGHRNHSVLSRTQSWITL